MATGSSHARYPDVLIVEDSTTQAMKLQYLLTSEGYSTATATNGTEAIQKIHESVPRAVITDVVMPEMGGYELCRRLKAEPAWEPLPVILLTTLSEPQDIIQGLDCGANHFLVKPYNDKVMLSAVKHLFLNIDLGTQKKSEMMFDIYFYNKRHRITADRIQIIDLLFSTFENTLQKNRELEEANRRLKEALDTIDTLKGLIPICANCKKIRDDKGFWESVESFISKHSGATFSHGICPECSRIIYPEFTKE